ncbi:CsbD family protein [Waterburya agarophytonicola K14]|uniref:CsbD family protein n=1 Tax=Waterburya agarophytonicola KI4 TaxID=2874699 RepID=A0A964FF34_9CYAN|nr:CsbD family protein [Waterburya agarophytonicola]MCC0175379.1 CsbD family protein [Waterburya agarophytonicola KI4]
MLHTQTTTSDLFKIYTRKVAIALMATAIVILAWSNLFFNISINANAATLDGVSDQIEGKVQKDIGTTRRGVGDLLNNPTEEGKGAITQAKGKAKQDIGTTKNKLNDAQDAVEDTSESLVDSVKDFFN